MGKAIRYDQLLDQLSFQLPAGVSQGVMMRALRDSGKRFCSESGAWRQNLTPITTVAEQLNYTVVNEWAADIAGINRVGIRTAAQITDDPDDEGTEMWNGGYKFLPSSQKLVFSGAPANDAVTDALLVKATLVPHDNSDEVAEWFISLYTGGIVSGAVESICMMPQFYNERIGTKAGRNFNNEVCRAVRDAETDFTEKHYQIKGGYALL